MLGIDGPSGQLRSAEEKTFVAIVSHGRIRHGMLEEQTWPSIFAGKMSGIGQVDVAIGTNYTNYICSMLRVLSANSIMLVHQLSIAYCRCDKLTILFRP